MPSLYGYAQEECKDMPKTTPGNFLNILQVIIWLQRKFCAPAPPTLLYSRTLSTCAFTHTDDPGESLKPGAKWEKMMVNKELGKTLKPTYGNYRIH